MSRPSTPAATLLLGLLVLNAGPPGAALASEPPPAVLPEHPDHRPATAEDIEEAREAHEETRRLYGSDDLEGALRSADRAFEHVPNASTAMVRATVLAALGRPCEAFAALLVARDLEPDEGQLGAIRVGLEKHGTGCGVGYGWLRFTLRPEAATVEVNGQRVGAGRSVGLPAGRHVVSVTAEGFRPESEEVPVVAGRGTNLELSLVPLPAIRMGPAQRQPPSAEEARPRTPESLPESIRITPAAAPAGNTLGWALLGGGAALMAGGGGLYAWARSAREVRDGYSKPDAGLSDSERKRLYDDADHAMRLREGFAWASLGAGAASVAVGAALLLSGDGAEPAGALLSLDGTGVVLAGRF